MCLCKFALRVRSYIGTRIQWPCLPKSGTQIPDHGLRTGWKYSTYSSPAMSVNEMGMETNVWHRALTENITVIALKELCCLLNIGISQHLMIKGATSENLYLIMWLLKKRTVQKIVTFLTDKKHPHLWMLCLAWLLYLLCGLRGLIKKLRQYLLQQFRK